MPKCNTNIAVTFRHSCLPVFTWRRVVLHIFDRKQLLRVSCTWWYYYSKCYSINHWSDCDWIIFIIWIFDVGKIILITALDDKIITCLNVHVVQHTVQIGEKLVLQIVSFNFVTILKIINYMCLTNLTS